jgi:hypothetical protein
MNFEYSLKGYLIFWKKLLISYLVLIITFYLTTDISSGPLWSFCSLFLASIIALWILFFSFLKNLGIYGFIIILSAFVFKDLIGTLHFLIFVQPNYFNGDTSYNFFYDYYWMHESVQYLADRVNNYGFFNALEFEYFILNKGAIIFYIYSPIYSIGGDLVLNLSHINTFFTLVTSIIITYIAEVFFSFDRKQVIATLLITSFFPFGLIPSMTMRDFAGQTLMAIGLVTLQYSFKNPKLFVLLFFSTFLFFLQRKNYIVLPIISYFVVLLFFSRQSGISMLSRSFFIRILFLCVTTLSGIKYFSFLTQIELVDTDSQLNPDYTADISTIQFYVFFPLYFLKGILGPFPWTQFFSFEPETIFQPSDYLTSTFIFTLIISLILRRKYISNLKSDINLFTFTSLLVSLGGIASGYMHLAYISISVIFLVPFAFKYLELKYFMRNYLVVFISLVFLSMIWVFFGFHGSGIWSDFKN